MSKDPRRDFELTMQKAWEAEEKVMGSNAVQEMKVRLREDERQRDRHASSRAVPAMFTAGLLVRQQIRRMLELAKLMHEDFDYTEVKGLLDSDFVLHGKNARKVWWIVIKSADDAGLLDR